MFHPVCDLFPPLEGQAFDELVQSIRETGLQNPIQLDRDGRVIDGRSRYRACRTAQVEPRFETWNGAGSLVEFVLAQNLHRRHLTPSQKATLAADLVPLMEEEARKRQAHGKTGPGKTLTETFPEAVKGESREKAGKLVGVNPHYVSDAIRLKERDPKAFKEVRTGALTLQQLKRSERKEVCKPEHAHNLELVSRPEPVDAGSRKRFPTIFIDPRARATDWCGNNEGLRLDHLADLPVTEMAEGSCHLYLWITNDLLPDGFQLLKRWGFRYVTAITCRRPKPAVGEYFREETEHILFGVRGSLPLLRHDVGTLLPADSGDEDVRPEEFYTIVETCSPGPWIDVLGGTTRAGWAALEPVR